MYNNFNKIIWGIIFVIININIGPIDILPNFIGYGLMISGLSKIYNETQNKEFLLTKILAVIFLIESLVSIFYHYNSIGNITINSMISNTVFQVLQLLLVFYMYSGIIELLKKYDDMDLVLIIRNARRNYAYITLLTMFLTTFAINMEQYSRDILLTVCVFVNLFMVVRWAFNVNKVKKFFMES